VITKDQASDLKSAIDHAQRRALDLQNAKLASEQANRELENALWQIQQKETQTA
jgi:hypothetical protein